MRARRESWHIILAANDVAEAAVAIVALSERALHEEERDPLAPMVAIKALARIIGARADQVAMALGGEPFGYFSDGLTASGMPYPPASEGTAES